VPRPPKTLKFEARPFSALIQDRPLPWPTPMCDLRLTYVFGLPDPRTLRPKRPTLTVEERELVQRFVAHTRSRAGTTLLGAGDGFTVNIADFGDEEAVSTELSDPDVTTGFMVLVRQCYATDEEASFSKVRKVLEHRLDEVGDAASLNVLKQWRKAQARLLNKTLEELVQEPLIVDAKMPGQLQDPDRKMSSSVVRDPASPAELLRTFWYGGQVHWGTTRKDLAAIQADPFDAARWDIAARQAATDFAHFYMGYALIAETIPNA
jgi:hypothetical protein